MLPAINFHVDMHTRMISQNMQEAKQHPKLQYIEQYKDYNGIVDRINVGNGQIITNTEEIGVMPTPGATATPK